MSAHLREAWGRLVTTAGFLEDAMAVGKAWRESVGGDMSQPGLCGHGSRVIHDYVPGVRWVTGEYEGMPHVWNEMPDGTIFDVTSDQFGIPGPRVVPRGSPGYDSYIPKGSPRSTMDTGGWEDWEDSYEDLKDLFHYEGASTEPVTYRVGREGQWNKLTVYAERASVGWVGVLDCYRHSAEGSVPGGPADQQCWVISGIEVYREEDRGKGIAEKMVLALHEAYPDYWIVHGGFVSDAGQGFGHKMVAEYPEWNKFHRTASTWRGFSADEGAPFWMQHDAVIATQMRGRDRYYEAWVEGRNYVNRPTLEQAQSAVEAKVGKSLTWTEREMPKVKVLHYYFGWTDEFTDPLVIYTADF